jgi:hypothetical protein
LGVAALSPANSIIIDPTGQWAELCDQFSVDPAAVLNQPVNDDTIFLWLMDHIFGVTQVRADNSELLIQVGGGPI